MSFIDSPGTLAIGDRAIEDEHRFLVGITNSLAEALETGDGAESVRQLADDADRRGAGYRRRRCGLDRL
jgi:hypothetical protein